ncbi:MAG TPA: AMP-binding protein [Paenirhodobacter sp.]
MTYTLKISVLDARNSLEFLEEVFRLYESGTPFAICRPGTEPADYPALHVERRIEVGTRYGWLKPVLAPAQSGHDDSPAQVVFSSGTEGKPKAIVISRAALADVEDRLLSVMQITAEIREYIGIPVTYSFGLGRARVVARAGGAFFLPERFDPVEIRDMLTAGEINAISAVPSMWRVMLARPDFLGDLGAQVRWIEIGSQYMSAEEKLALRRMFPNARIVQHYGLTEASRSTFLVISEAAPDVLESVGGPIGLTEVKIGTESEICIRGPHLASGVLSEAGTLVPLAAEDGWLHTRDKGELRDGWLYYLGRLDDQINLSGIKLSAEALETDVAALVTLEPGHFALSSVRDALRGETILLGHDTVAAPHAGLLQSALVQVLATKGIHAAGQIRMLALEELPRTGTGKIRRKELRAIWDAETVLPVQGETPRAVSPLNPAQERIAEVWRSVLGPTELRPENGFYDVGGDSLGAMQIGLAMEAHFPRPVVRATLEGRSLADIARLLEEDGVPISGEQTLPVRTVKSWGVNAARGFMVITVLMSHWMPGIWERLVPGLHYDPLAFVSRMGTPGFAIVFGLGIACFMLDGYPQNRFSVRRRQLFSLLFVFLAILMIALIGQTLRIASGVEMTGRSWGEAFYNVLSFYFLALATVSLWLRLLHGRIFVVAAVSVPILWGVWLLAQLVIGHDYWESPLEWVRLMFVAKYSYFPMMALVLAGVALGSWMMRVSDLSLFVRQAALIGGVLLACGLIMVIEIWGVGVLIDREAPFWFSFLGVMIYVGFTALLLAAAVWALGRWTELPLGLHLLAKGLILLGGLALPVFAMHELVIPLKNLMLLTGLPGVIALAVPMAGFLAAIVYGMWRLNKMYFR